MKNFLIDSLTPSATQIVYNTIKNLAESISKKTRITRSNEIGTEISNMICEVIITNNSIKKSRNFKFKPEDQGILKIYISELILNMSDTDFSLFEKSLNHYNKLLAELPETVNKHTTYSWNILGPLGSFIKFALSFTYASYIINCDNNSYLYLKDRTKATQEIEEKFKTMVQELKWSEAKNRYYLWCKQSTIVTVAALFLVSVAGLLKPEDITNWFSEEFPKNLCNIL